MIRIRSLRYLASQNQDLKNENKSLRKENDSLLKENTLLKGNLSTASEEYSKCLSQLKDAQKQYNELIYDTRKMREQYQKDMSAFIDGFHKHGVS